MGDAMPRVVLMSGEYPPAPGGMGLHAHRLALELHRLGLPIAVFACLSKARREEAAEFDARQPFPIRRYHRDARGALGRRRLRRTLMKMFADYKTDVTLFSGRRAGAVTVDAAKRRGIPVTALALGSEFTRQSERDRARVRRVYGSAETVVAISSYTADLVARSGIPSESVRVVLPGAAAVEQAIPPDAAVAELRRELGLGDDKVLLTVGRVSPRKAQDTVIRALPDILARWPNTVYLIAGKPDHADVFSALAEKLGLADRVRFLGVVPDARLPALYRLCDVFILNSRIDRHGACEGFGMVLIEANLMERPVIGTRGCGCEDAVVHEETGLLVDMNAPDQTAAAALRLLDAPDWAARLGHNGRRRALEELTWDRTGREVAAVLRDAVRRRGVGGRMGPQAVK
jgi:phosphatidylinositol alpha-1,6-mannosyltransferase